MGCCGARNLKTSNDSSADPNPVMNDALYIKSAGQVKIESQPNSTLDDMRSENESVTSFQLKYYDCYTDRQFLKHYRRRSNQSSKLKFMFDDVFGTEL
ncbi:hypothetical protein Bpfe_018442 [Biomphalaria pfeifferi]|uniref:Uncharacterized protein n=1 Tax=Biomphalaria pfeifferi TaxID=112525 RepID=A0AAD8F552_BIOPF|nr:hypothetical protein Bpfe_018442 [Biomphalaria pfeifferi]